MEVEAAPAVEAEAHDGDADNEEELSPLEKRLKKVRRAKRGVRSELSVSGGEWTRHGHARSGILRRVRRRRACVRSVTPPHAKPVRAPQRARGRHAAPRGRAPRVARGAPEAHCRTADTASPISPLSRARAHRSLLRATRCRASPASSRTPWTPGPPSAAAARAASARGRGLRSASVSTTTSSRLAPTTTGAHETGVGLAVTGLCAKLTRRARQIRGASEDALLCGLCRGRGPRGRRGGRLAAVRLRWHLW